jgi:hypothetical protein
LNRSNKIRCYLVGDIVIKTGDMWAVFWKEILVSETAVFCAAGFN